MSELEKKTKEKIFSVSTSAVKFNYSPEKNSEEEQRYDRFLGSYGEKVFPSKMSSSENFFHAAKMSGMDEIFARRFSREAEILKYKILAKMAAMTIGYYFMNEKFPDDSTKTLNNLVCFNFWGWWTLKFFYTDFTKFVFNKDLLD